MTAIVDVRRAVEQRPPDHKLVAGELDYATAKKDSDMEDEGGDDEGGDEVKGHTLGAACACTCVRRGRLFPASTAAFVQGVSD